MSLQDYGWDSFFASNFEALAAESWLPGRGSLERRGEFILQAESGEFRAQLTGRLRYRARSVEELPAVGDWVAFSNPGGDDSAIARIHQLLPRRTKISRKVAGAKTEAQVIAANVDKIFVMMGLDSDFNLRRVERLLVTAWDSGAQPLVLLNKLDLCSEPDERKRQVESVAPGVSILLISCLDQRGLDQVRAAIAPRETVALLGSSGVGKSTLINALLVEEKMRTQEVRKRDERGQHTTTHRELVKLPGAGLLIDNPGIREVQLWTDYSPASKTESSASDVADEVSPLSDTFADIERLAESCRFRDCGHSSEPGCAIQQALNTGELSPKRFENYQALQNELRYLARRQDKAAQSAEKKKWKSIHKDLRVRGHRRT